MPRSASIGSKSALSPISTSSATGSRPWSSTWTRSSSRAAPTIARSMRTWSVSGATVRPAGQRELGVGELVHGPSPLCADADEQARCVAGDPDLVAGQEAAVVEVQAERVLALQRHLALGGGDQEHVAVLEDDGVDEVPGAAHRPRS